MKKYKIPLIVVACIILIELALSNRKCKVFYVKNNPFGFNANTIAPLGIFINEKQKGNTYLLAHEICHWNQYKRYGFFGFYLMYLFSSIFGYDKNQMEIEARYLETEYCKKNYTECVSNGTAITV